MGEKLADAHVEWVLRVLQAHEVDPRIVLLVGFHYREAFIHGYKHGIEDTKSKLFNAHP